MAPRKPRTNGVERAFQIIECLVNLGEAATAYQVAKLISAPLSTIYESVALLEKLDVLTRYGADGKFFLGPRLLVYGLSYQHHLEADEIYRRAGDALSRLTGENVQICFRDGDYLVVAAMSEGSDHLRISPRAGTRVPLTWSASGRLLIGHLTLEQRAEIFARARPSPSGRAVTDPELLEASCREAWERGWCMQTAESEFAVACIAAPILTTLKECGSTISVIVPEATAEKRGVELSRHVIAAANNIEKHLGWHILNGNGSRTRWNLS